MNKPTETSPPEAETVSPPDAEPAAAQTQGEVTPEPEPPATAGRSWTGLLALLIALGAAAATGYLWTLQQNQQAALAQVDRLASQLQSNQGSVAQLSTQQSDTAATNAQLQAELSELNERLLSQRKTLDELPPRLTRLERALEELPGISDQARAAWLIAEAEYYLRIANAQIQLARNAEVALRAQQLADEKLRDAADPRLTQVRAALADEMTALRAVPRPDTEGIVLAISSLARALDELPLAQQGPSRYGQQQLEDDGSSGLARAWARLREALLSLVRIKKTDEAASPLRTAAEESLLLRRLEAELELARGALLNGQGQLYRSLLDDVKASIRRHFDNDAPAVRAAINQLADLARAELPEALPDISGSLELLLRVAGEAPAQ
ncbi:MAG: uroporphyrinogen-III C-methyltransferase [Gammaproteobacteria bacterium]